MHALRPTGAARGNMHIFFSYINMLECIQRYNMVCIYICLYMSIFLQCDDYNPLHEDVSSLSLRTVDFHAI
jgi:hypothetical protein